MAGGFPFSSVPWYTINAAKFEGNVGLGPSARAATPNCSLRCNCKAGFETLTDGSKCTASRYWDSDDYSGGEVRRCCDPSSSSAAVYELARDLGKCSNNCAPGNLLGSAFKATNSAGLCIRSEEQRPVMDANFTATSGQNPPKAVLHSLNGGRTRPKYGSDYKTRSPTQKVFLEFKPYSIDDAYYPNMLSNSSEGLESVSLSANNTEPKVEIYSNDLASFSDSIDESCLQEGYARGRGKYDINKIQESGNVSKRKAREMERKAVATDVQSGRNVDEGSRIVRVSRLAGGKDRHSKVLTAKGIRDRRVRLSVPTAIQFYDLQDRLGFEQPSKAVDWLIQNARSAIDQLPVLDVEMTASATPAGNTRQLFSSNSSDVKHCVASSRESATATAASAFRFGLSSLEGRGTSSHKAINDKGKPIMALENSDYGKSSGSTSDGSIKGSVEHYTSYSSMSKPSSKVDTRLKARERARKKSTSAIISATSPSAIPQLKLMQPSLTCQFEGVLPFTRVSEESECIKDDNPSGIHTQVSLGIDSVQPLWDYNMPSYSSISQNSHLPQSMATLSSSAIQNCFLPVPSNSDSIQTVMGSSPQSFERAESALPFSDPTQSRHLGGNAALSQANLLYSNTPMHIVKSVDQQQQQQSVIVPRFSNDIDFSTSSLSSRGPLQSNSSASITNLSCLPDSEESLW